MKRFKDLSVAQKKNAVDIVFNQLVEKKVREAMGTAGFCGCAGCRDEYDRIINKDPQLKESLLVEAIDKVEQAYYPEESDTIIKVS